MRIARVPLVVVRISVRALRTSSEVARRSADVEPFHDDCVALAADDRLVAELGTQRPRLVDLGAAEHPLVARRKRLGDRRRRADHVDHDPDMCSSFLLRSERDVNVHPDTLAAWKSRATAIDTPTGRPVSRARSAGGPSATSA